MGKSTLPRSETRKIEWLEQWCEEKCGKGNVKELYPGTEKCECYAADAGRPPKYVPPPETHEDNDDG